MVKRLGYSLVCLLAFASCQREDDVVQPIVPETAQPAAPLNPVADFVQTAVSDPNPPATGEFISGEFDGRVLNCTNDRWGTGGRTYRSATDEGLFVRQNLAGDIQLNINFNYTNIFTATMPAVWPQNVTNPLICQGFLMDLYSLAPDNGVKMLFHGATGAQIIPGSTNRMKFTVTSVTGNFIEGTFEGPLHVFGPLTPSDYYAKYSSSAYLPVTVKNGKFRIKATTL